MNRIETARKIIYRNRNNINSVLDIGCRDCYLNEKLPRSIKYYGNDILQNKQETVHYVGDFVTTTFSEKKFDMIIALDVLEHTDNLHKVFEKIVKISNGYIVVNLPNNYSFKDRFKFFLKGTLGKKYEFQVENSLDRHKWVMSRNEIIRFYEYQGRKYNLKLQVMELKYGDFNKGIIQRLKMLISTVLPASWFTHSVLGVFKK